MPIAKGTQIGPYEIVGWLGAGGMGEVYRARDPRLGRLVAIKLIHEGLATDATRVHRFEQEARAAGQLNHPNILAVYDIGVHGASPYIVSELLEGESLRSALHGGRLSTRKAVDYARQTAEGLAAAHDKGIVHRDVKPDNLFICNDGRIKILDFGIAKLTRPSEDAGGHTGLPTETGTGMVVGTVGYMSPEQVRGEPIDGRSDLFSLGTVLYEMLTGAPAFGRGTAADTMAAILKDDPPRPMSPDVSPALARMVARCLEKSCEMRFQSARDLAFGLDVMSGTNTSAVPSAVKARPRRWPVALGAAVVLLSLATAVASWLSRGTAPALDEIPLANAEFTPFTDWDGAEEGAAISPDGRFVTFLSDRDGEFDLWLSQVGTGQFRNLTRDVPALETGVLFIIRRFGFSGDGSEIWFSRGSGPSMAQLLLPLLSGTPRPFLDKNATAPAWAPDDTRLVYFKNESGDPLFIADRTGSNPRQIDMDKRGGAKRFYESGMHNHNPVWSTDGQWIYFLHGASSTEEMDVWRVRPSGESPEQLTRQNAAMGFLAALNARTLLYISRAADGSGPWLWSLDVDRKVSRRVNVGLGQQTSVSASLDGRHVVTTVTSVRSGLWRVPLLLDRQADEGTAEPYLPNVRAIAPRFGGSAMYYLSARGTGDGLWRVQDGQASEIRKGMEGVLSEPPAASPDGSRVAAVIRQQGKRRLAIMSADGRNSRLVAESLDIQGAAGQGAADWSPDGAWIAAGGIDTAGPGLFKIPADHGAPERLVNGQALNPVWSPDGKLIVYSGPFFTGQVELLGVRPDGTPVELPSIRTRPGGYRFLPNGSGLVYLPFLQSMDFWLLDFATKKTRQLTGLKDQGVLQTFDITPDGKAIVFDRSRKNSDIILIELPR